MTRKDILKGSGKISYEEGDKNMANHLTTAE